MPQLDGTYVEQMQQRILGYCDGEILSVESETYLKTLERMEIVSDGEKQRLISEITDAYEALMSASISAKV